MYIYTSVHNEQIYVYANVNPLWFSLPVADISWDFMVKFLCQINTSVQINGNGMMLVFSYEFSVQKYWFDWMIYYDAFVLGIYFSCVSVYFPHGHSST